MRTRDQQCSVRNQRVAGVGVGTVQTECSRTGLGQIARTANNAIDGDGETLVIIGGGNAIVDDKRTGGQKSKVACLLKRAASRENQRCCRTQCGVVIDVEGATGVGRTAAVCVHTGQGQLARANFGQTERAERILEHTVERTGGARITDDEIRVTNRIINRTGHSGTPSPQAIHRLSKSSHIHQTAIGQE